MRNGNKNVHLDVRPGQSFADNLRKYMKRQKGFTLIELMAVVAVLAILAAIALPAYNEQVKRGRRADGKAFIMDIASRQERFYTQYSSYTSVVVGAGDCGGVACGLNYEDNLSPEGFYSVQDGAIDVEPDDCAPGGDNPCTRFTITIVPQFADEKCTELSLDNTGTEGPIDSDTLEYCWR